MTEGIQAQSIFRAKTSDVILRLVSITHPDFSQEYHFVTNAINNVTVVLEDDTEQEFTYYPLRVTLMNNGNTLEQRLRFDLGDVGTIVSSEIKNVILAEGEETKPTVIYREYVSSDLTSPSGIYTNLKIENISMDREATSFEAVGENLNNNKTGQNFNISEIPMLAGFAK